MFPGIVLGNGATVRKKEYLQSIGVTHILNAAEFRGVNVGEDYFGSGFQYMGLRVEDTPQTQICRSEKKIKSVRVGVRVRDLESKSQIKSQSQRLRELKTQSKSKILGE